MTLLDRAESYAQAFPKFPASHLRPVYEQGRHVLYGRWVLGNNYRAKAGYYGEYPPGYLDRVMAMFPYEGRLLHVFSGSLPAGSYERCDVQQDAEYQCDVLDLPTNENRNGHRWKLVIADPPYSEADATKYGTPMIDRRKVLAALAEVTQSGGHLCWLDTCWPMHSKKQWLTVGRIAITRSTNHRIRDLTIFQRQDRSS